MDRAASRRPEPQPKWCDIVSSHSRSMTSTQAQTLAFGSRGLGSAPPQARCHSPAGGTASPTSCCCCDASPMSSSRASEPTTPPGRGAATTLSSLSFGRLLHREEPPPSVRVPRDLTPVEAGAAHCAHHHTPEAAGVPALGGDRFERRCGGGVRARSGTDQRAPPQWSDQCQQIGHRPLTETKSQRWTWRCPYICTYS